LSFKLFYRFKFLVKIKNLSKIQAHLLSFQHFIVWFEKPQKELFKQSL